MKKMPENIDELYYWFALDTVPGLGLVLYRRLLGHFGSPQNVLSASLTDIESVSKIGKKLALAIKEKVNYNKAEKHLKNLENSDFNVITIKSSDYPELLKNIYDPPPFFFYAGDISCLNSPTIGIVGSRSLSAYGKMIAEKLSRELTDAGLTVVSGFARGIDTIAHRAALENHGKTAAVFGSGLDVIYPPENKALYKELLLNGCAFSEFYLKERPEAKNFPRRNRIISGLSQGVVLVEAGEKSGALLTAQHALDQGREVFAVPGKITSKTSAGTNRIIRDGAKLVMSAEDILEELKFLVPKSKPSAINKPDLKLDSNSKKIYEVLSDQPIHIDKIVKQSRLSISNTLEILLDLELNGFVKQLSGKTFVKQP